MDSDLSRIGISLPSHLLDRFDDIINQRGTRPALRGSAMQSVPILPITSGCLT